MGFLKTFIDKCHFRYYLENSDTTTVLHTVYKIPNIFMCFSEKTHYYDLLAEWQLQYQEVWLLCLGVESEIYS